jgi:hypothetical protein
MVMQRFTSTKEGKEYTFCTEVTAIVFWDSTSILFIDFLTEQTINAVYYSKLQKTK